MQVQFAIIFKTVALAATEVAICVALSCPVFVAVENEKWLIRCGLLDAGERRQKSE